MATGFLVNFRAAFTENFVTQEITFHKGKSLYYWSSNGQAKVANTIRFLAADSISDKVRPVQWHQ